MEHSILANWPVKPRLAEDDGRDLVARLAAGDPAALTTLVEQYRERVIMLAARLLGWNDGAEDVMQSVFLAVWRHRARFRGDSAFWTYLTSITLNHCRSLQRRRWMEERVRRLVGASQHTTHASNYQFVHASETADAVRRAIAQLAPKYREAVVLRYMEELSIDEIARVMGRKRNAIEARLSRARKLLSESLQELCE